MDLAEQSCWVSHARWLPYGPAVPHTAVDVGLGTPHHAGSVSPAKLPLQSPQCIPATGTCGKRHGGGGHGDEGSLGTIGLSACLLLR